MTENVGFRGWFYFRQGWTTYFAFIFAAINTMVVTYYLAIENMPYLKVIFPSFYIYLTIVSCIGIPLLIFIGYAHQKKTASYKAEADIYYESNPHSLRMYNNAEMILQLNLKLIDFLIIEFQKTPDTNKKLDELLKLKTEIENYIQIRQKDKKSDVDLFRKFSKG